MRINLFSYALLLATLSAAAGCHLGIPTEADIRAKINGDYCADNAHFLEIMDSTYTCSYRLNDTLTQQCAGVFSLHEDADRWEIHFMPDTNADLLYRTNCEKIYTLWTAKEGYLIGRDTVRMRDLFTNMPLLPCGK